MMHLDPKLFRAFKAVAESRSFNDAADIAAMTQANISKHIKATKSPILAKTVKAQMSDVVEAVHCYMY